MYSELPGHPHWQRGARPRLVACIVFAAILVAAFIGLVTFSQSVEPLAELEVYLLSPRQPEPPEPAPQEEAIDEQPNVPAAVIEEMPEADDAAPRDWYAQMKDAVESTVAEQRRVYAVNPAFEDKRRQAALQFAPSRAPREKPIWENVETDQLGRKILVSGDCHRVIDDPSAANAEIFRTFHQYIVFCTKYQRQPRELPWAEEVRERHAYLRVDAAGESPRTDLLARRQ